MDTQGTFDNRATKKQTVTIFSLSTLLSSIQIYNVSEVKKYLSGIIVHSNSRGQQLLAAR